MAVTAPEVVGVPVVTVAVVGRSTKNRERRPWDNDDDDACTVVIGSKGFDESASSNFFVMSTVSE